MISIHGLGLLARFCPILVNFDDGGRKATPGVFKDTLRKIASISPEASAKLEEVLDPMMTAQPAQLGYRHQTNQSSYYPGKEWITKEEIETATKIMETNGLQPSVSHRCHI
ncbi:hypothetical protein CBS147325_1885 [Penicillium roqueforti]|nr:hypothetical protein CBS147325_1885 [Penicillium roqueforti]KAI3181331.1 hypothetical protein DTO046C5_752 [Penicillium roqueforti]KAI3196246.1 hypothetical protein CBS147311_7527 [Penicillium roqueforti]